MRLGKQYSIISEWDLYASILTFTLFLPFFIDAAWADDFFANSEVYNAGVSSSTPDIIVGEIQEILTYGIDADGKAAFAIGTISCNKGHGSANWIWNTPDHPVIAQHIYRLHQNRFEQIGMSWVKHGFFASSQSWCSGPGGCAGNFSGTQLGPGCSDPYSASTNGAQASLGPRSDINAFTGEFPYPFTARGASGLTGKRIVVTAQDYMPAQNVGAQYFAEAQYITKDDADAGAQHNNASYRPMRFIDTPQASISAELLGETQRTKPAIRAWRIMDPSVIETNILVPGDGLFILAAKATALGGGQWSYEYALHNLNVHRSAERFTIPVETSALCTNIGFHDVNYHSGELYNSSDWSFSEQIDSLTWETETFAVNPNSNALRWGTLYNFRFVSDKAPVATTVTIRLFRPGPIDSISALTIGPARTLLDCNGNGIDDLCDIDCQSVGLNCDQLLCGTSNDINTNTIPDECEADCDSDGVPDSHQVSINPSIDCNNNLVPDTCETDTDGDLVIDVCDPCPLDMFDDSDGDGVCDSSDGCPLDVGKIDVGVCGCGTADLDSDVDGRPDCVDNCVSVPNPDQLDTDIDLVGDLCDNCVTQPNSDQTDTDADTVGDACDPCPFENPDDVDLDGVCFPTDMCPADGLKIDPGVCGCGIPETDDDGDGWPNCMDECPVNPEKFEAGICGCSSPDADADGDSIVDCLDVCPGVDDLLDLDNNGLPDCVEHIPTVSTWGFMILALMLLTVSKVYRSTQIPS